MPSNTCAVETCEKEPKTRDWCDAHYGRWYRHGDPLGGGARSGPKRHDRPGYDAAHARVYRARGRARQHACQCGAQAAQWAYDHTDPAPLVETLRNMIGEFAEMTYSADPSRYVALCRSCHVKLDKGTIRLTPQRYV